MTLGLAIRSLTSRMQVPFCLLAPKLLEGRHRLRIISKRRRQLLQAASKQPCPAQPPKLALLLHQHAHRHKTGIALLCARVAPGIRAEPGISFVRKVDEIALDRVQPRRQRLVFDRVFERDIGCCGAFPRHSIPKDVCSAQQLFKVLSLNLGNDQETGKPEMLAIKTYPTFLSNLIKNSASTLGASSPCESTFVALDCVEADMVE
jgi:hypothetical protein